MTQSSCVNSRQRFRLLFKVTVAHVVRLHGYFSSAGIYLAHLKWRSGKVSNTVSRFFPSPSKSCQYSVRINVRRLRGIVSRAKSTTDTDPSKWSKKWHWSWFKLDQSVYWPWILWASESWRRWKWDAYSFIGTLIRSERRSSSRWTTSQENEVLISVGHVFFGLCEGISEKMINEFVANCCWINYFFSRLSCLTPAEVSQLY